MCALLCLFLLQDKDTELCSVNVKVQQLEAELQDLSSQESKDEASLAKIKKQLRDLEAKVKDQEEELDEQAGTIQMLEQVRSGGDADMVNYPHMEKVFAKSCLYNGFNSFSYSLVFMCNSVFLHFFFFVILCVSCYVLRLSCGWRWKWKGSDRPTLKRLRARMKR